MLVWRLLENTEEEYQQISCWILFSLFAVLTTMSCISVGHMLIWKCRSLGTSLYSAHHLHRLLGAIYYSGSVAIIWTSPWLHHHGYITMATPPCLHHHGYTTMSGYVLPSTNSKAGGVQYLGGLCVMWG